MQAAAASKSYSGVGVRSALCGVGPAAYRKSHNVHDLAMSAVGVVTEAWVDRLGRGHCCGWLLQQLPGVRRLVQSGKVVGLSLTHAKGAGEPVEVTLTSTPARPGCRIDAYGPSAVSAYKRRNFAHCVDLAMDTTTAAAAAADPPAVAPSPLETALSKLENSDRGLIEARMEQMVEAADAADARAKQLEISATDFAVVQDQLDTVTAQLSEKQREIYKLEPKLLGQQMCSDNKARSWAATNRLLMACSAQMMSQQAASEEAAPNAKRARVEPAAVMAVDSGPPSAGGAQSALARALATSFEMG
jgi:hypothetical protein